MVARLWHLPLLGILIGTHACQADDSSAPASPLATELFSFPSSDKEAQASGSFGLAPQATEKRASVIIVAIDGLRAGVLHEARIPNLKRLIDLGASTLDAQNVMPATSGPNWMSLLTAATPLQHGVSNEYWRPGDSNPPPTLFALVQQAHPASTWVITEWDELPWYFEPDSVDHLEVVNGQGSAMRRAVDVLRQSLPTLMMIHMDHVDHAGHSEGWESTAYKRAVEDADTQIGTLVQAIADRDAWDRTVLIITSDHGGSARGHGRDTPVERTIPLILFGAKIRRHLTLPPDLRIFDLAPTAARLLGVTYPDAWLGRPILMALEDFSGEAPLNAAFPPLDPLGLEAKDGFSDQNLLPIAPLGYRCPLALEPCQFAH